MTVACGQLAVPCLFPVCLPASLPAWLTLLVLWPDLLSAPPLVPLCPLPAPQRSPFRLL